MDKKLISPLIKRSIEYFKELYPDIESELTQEEIDLLNRLKKPPKCMHEQEYTSEDETYITCNACGLIARKSIEVYPGVWINEI